MQGNKTTKMQEVTEDKRHETEKTLLWRKGNKMNWIQGDNR